MNKYFKNIIGFLIILIPSVLLLGFLLKNLSKKSFYPNSGSEKISGISSKVKIYSDDYGVPHLFAQNEKDMYFAMGYMHARDRLWQMDLTRRVAEGRLSEILGSTTIDFDKLFRTIGIDRFSYKLYNNISPKSKEILNAYSNGINKFIETHINELPVEFDALNYRPEPWKPEHSLMIARLIGWEQNICWYTDYVMGELLEKFGPEKVAEIFPDTNITIFKKPKTTEDTTGIELNKTTLQKKESVPEIQGLLHPNISIDNQLITLAGTYFDYNIAYRKFFNLDCSHMGSNCWVVSGEKSETGKPLLANDPHLPLSAPSKWYEIHMSSQRNELSSTENDIKSGAIDVYGMSIAGTPGIIIGHNRIISWGITNLMNDDNDFCILDRDSTDITKYKYKNQSFQFDTLFEKIKVKDSSDVDFSVILTHIGPVISNLNKRSLIDHNNSENIYNKKILTFRWTGFEFSDEIGAIYKINKARNWDEFKNGLKDYGVPAQNFMYADTMGNIGYCAAGKIPIRKSNNINDCIFPNEGDNEWIGFVDFDMLPNIYNPKQNYIITANTNPFDWLKEFTTSSTPETKNRYYISYIWEPSSRYDRIREIINGNKKINLEEYKLIQMNYISPYARNVSKSIVDAYKDGSIPDNRIKAIIEQLKSWNGEISPSQSIGTIYNVFLCFLIKNIFMDKMDDKIFSDFLTVGNLVYRSISLLLKSDDKNSLWLMGNKNGIIKKSMEDATQFIENKFNNPDPDSWHWGELHKVKFRHPFGFVPALDKTFNIGTFEVGGDQTTVNNAEFKFYGAISEGNYDDLLGPSMRMLVDLSDITHSYTVNSTGQSGQPLHPNYSDQTRLWLYGSYKHNLMNETEMIMQKYNLIILEP